MRRARANHSITARTKPSACAVGARSATEIAALRARYRWAQTYRLFVPHEAGPAACLLRVSLWDKDFKQRDMYMGDCCLVLDGDAGTRAGEVALTPEVPARRRHHPCMHARVQSCKSPLSCAHDMCARACVLHAQVFEKAELDPATTPKCTVSVTFETSPEMFTF